MEQQYISSKYSSKACAYTPQSSKGTGKIDNAKNSKDGKFDKDTTLKSASESNPIPVIVEPDGVLSNAVIVDQNENGVQVYVTGFKEDESGKITKVRLARYDDNSELVSIHWIDPDNVNCGIISQEMIDIDTKDAVQGEPEVDITIEEDEDNRVLESFIFFDPFFGDRRPKPEQTQEEWESIYENSLKLGIGFQREIAKFMGIYNGQGSISEKQQEEIEKQIHIVPFSDIPDKYVQKYPEYKANPTPGINGDKMVFYDYWNNNIANDGKKIHIVVLHNHAGADGLSILEGGAEVIKMWELKNINIPRIDYVLLLGCNMADVNVRPNFTSTFASLTKQGNPIPKNQSLFEQITGKKKEYAVYETCVVGADGSTYTSPDYNKNGEIVGAHTQTAKYTGSDHTHHIYGVGFCVYKKGMADNDNPISIPGTSAEPSEQGGDLNWVLHPISISALLKKTEKIRNSGDAL